MSLSKITTKDILLPTIDPKNDWMETITCSRLFLLPLIYHDTEGESLYSLRRIGLVNSYLYDPRMPSKFKKDDVILAVFFPNDDRDYDALYEYLNKIESHRCHGIYVYEKQKCVVVCYEFTESINKIIKLFWKGQYSKFPEELKDVISGMKKPTKVLSYKNNTSTLQRMIFDKDPLMKEYWEKVTGVKLPDNAELWSKPSVEKETLNIENLTKTISFMLENYYKS